MMLNKTFEIKNSNFNDSLIINSVNFKTLKESKSSNKDSIRYFNWRIGDMKYHNNFSKDTIEIIAIKKDGRKINYKFLYQNNKN